MDDDQHLSYTQSYGRVISSVLELVIGNHLENSVPVVLEGDFIQPSHAKQPAYNGIQADGRVRAVFLYEPEQQQIAHNYLVRAGEDQSRRAHLSWRYSEWLRYEAKRLGIPVVAARPWETVLDRVIAALA